jgi:hypothetical protein
MFTLKDGVQGFTVIDGPMAGKSFKKGKFYGEIPPQEAAKFEEVKAQGASASAEVGRKATPATDKNKEVK